MSEKEFDQVYGRDDSAETLLPFQSIEEQTPAVDDLVRKSKTKQLLGIGRQILLFALAFWGLFSIASSLIYHHAHGEIHSHDESQHTHSQAPLEHDLDMEKVVMPAHHQPRRKPCSCGSTVKESIAMGCVYDSLSPAWLQPHCHDHALVQEFESIGDGPNGTWLYWADKNHTIPLTLHQVSLLADDIDARFHMSWDWHVQHCAMYWLKLQRSWKGLVTMENRYDNEKHIRHCVETFSDKAWGTESGVVLDADYFVD